MNVNKQYLKGLAQVGFTACFRDLPNEAVAIFEGISAVDPNSSRVKTGLALAYLNAYRIDEAIALFREAIKLEPENATAKSFLGLALKLAGSEEGDAVLNALAADGDCQESKDFAQAVLKSPLLQQQAAQPA